MLGVLTSPMAEPHEIQRMAFMLCTGAIALFIGYMHPFLAGLTGKRGSREILFSWLSLIVFFFGICFLAPGLMAPNDPALRREMFNSWVPEGPAVVAVAFMGWVPAWMSVGFGWVARQVSLKCWPKLMEKIDGRFHWIGSPCDKLTRTPPNDELREHSTAARLGKWWARIYFKSQRKQGAETTSVKAEK